MEDPVATRGSLESLVTLQTLGIPVVVIHGGGKPIDRAMAASGLVPRKVAGRRYTDPATLDIVVRVLRDEINAGLVESLNSLGGSAYACSEALAGQKLTLSGDDGSPIDLGHVGTVTRVDAVQLLLEIREGRMPIIPSIARTDDGSGWLNINADTAASAVAGSLGALACWFLTDTPGVMRDIRDPHSRFPQLSRAECLQLIRDGVIAGGMVPKVEACFEALDAGATRAVILDGRNPYALLGELIDENPQGTAIVP